MPSSTAGGDAGPEVALLVDDEVGTFGVEELEQVRGRGPREHVGEHPSAERQVRTSALVTREAGRTCLGDQS
jgi:hypothetical protein